MCVFVRVVVLVCTYVRVCMCVCVFVMCVCVCSRVHLSVCVGVCLWSAGAPVSSSAGPAGPVCSWTPVVRTGVGRCGP